MASTSVSVEEFDRPETSSDEGKFIRVIVADTQAIFRAGLRKIFAVEDDIRVVGQAETLEKENNPFAPRVNRRCGRSPLPVSSCR